MERIEAINPQRVSWCCADAGIGLEDLAAETNIPLARLERALQGEGLTFHQLQRVANYFNRGLLFFLEPGPVNAERAHSPQFRSIANQKPALSAKLRALIERVEAQRSVYLSLLEDLGKPSPDRFSPPDLEGLKIQKAAAAVRRWLGLAEKNSFDSLRAAVERVGVLVFRTNGYTGKWQIAKENPVIGFSLYHSEWPVIVIKKDVWETMQSFTLMHELGHILLHKQSSIDDADDLRSYKGQESEANAFAGRVLVPTHLLARIDHTQRPHAAWGFDDWLKPFSRAWGVSTEVILRRLTDEGHIERDEYRAYREWRQSQPVPENPGGTRLYRYREPRHIFGDTYVRTVFDALNSEKISLAKASSYLDGLKIKDLHRLEEHYASF